MSTCVPSYPGPREGHEDISLCRTITAPACLFRPLFFPATRPPLNCCAGAGVSPLALVQPSMCYLSHMPSDVSDAFSLFAFLSLAFSPWLLRICLLGQWLWCADAVKWPYATRKVVVDRYGPFQSAPWLTRTFVCHPDLGSTAKHIPTTKRI